MVCSIVTTSPFSREPKAMPRDQRKLAAIVAANARAWSTGRSLVSLYYLLLVFVMLITSLKTLDDLRTGNLR
jgi:hypothetical protein